MKAEKTWRPLGRTENNGILPEVYQYRFLHGDRWYEGTRMGEPQKDNQVYRVPGSESFKVRVARCSNPLYSYASKVGQYLEVEVDPMQPGKWFHLLSIEGFIEIKDCIRVPEIPKGKRLLLHDENDGILPEDYEVWDLAGEYWTEGDRAGRIQFNDRIYIVPDETVPEAKLSRDEAHDRKICEQIVERGGCDNISCLGDDCPLSARVGGLIQCAGVTGHGHDLSAARAWLKAHPKPPAPVTGVAEKEAKKSIKMFNMITQMIKLEDKAKELSNEELVEELIANVWSNTNTVSWNSALIEEAIERLKSQSTE